MPADVSYLYGVSPPFHQAYSTPFCAAVTNSKDYWQSSYSVFSTQKLNLSPCFARKSVSKTLKSCIKSSKQEADSKLLSIPTSSQNSQITKDSNIKVSGAQQQSPDFDGNIEKKERRVTFADFYGHSLTSVKFVTESTNEPPQCITRGDLARKFQRNLSLGSAANKDDSQDINKFTLQFKQPVADYVGFKQQIVKKNVSLENIVVKDNKILHGTIKVKNIAYDKSVDVRLTTDNWKTFQDYECQYVKDAYENGEFDTFHFNVTIPSISENIDCLMFCIKFVCNGAEYWDNHDGSNYRITVSNKAKQFTAIHVAPSSDVHRNPFPSTYNELPGPEFNSWDNWEGSGPFY
uniref:Protein phosphatase 1 regulatory subunit 3B-like n=1 Tax=Phallusia mammillata TaxID=59560 RepID=A0A6F9DNT2_9ASCI|nr:protein phosphatase 1 regulatory subunit 3B-like [Phallusia mammillata]